MDDGSKKLAFDILQVCIRCDKATVSYITDSDVSKTVLLSLNSENEELQRKTVRFVSSVLCFITNKTSDNFLSIDVFPEILKFADKGASIKRDIVCFLCNISSFDIPVIIKLNTIGYFAVVNKLIREMHSFSKGLLLSALWAVFMAARRKGYTIEREITKEYLKVEGMEVIRELEKSSYKGIRERVMFVKDLGN